MSLTEAELRTAFEEALADTSSYARVEDRYTTRLVAIDEGGLVFERCRACGGVQVYVPGDGVPEAHLHLKVRLPSPCATCARKILPGRRLEDIRFKAVQGRSVGS